MNPKSRIATRDFAIVEAEDRSVSGKLLYSSSDLSFSAAYA